MTEEIINSDGSRNWQANILLDNVKRLEQENKELKELNKKICEDWEKEIKVYWNALEEIKKLAETGAVQEDCYSCNEIVEKIDEVIG